MNDKLTKLSNRILVILRIILILIPLTIIFSWLVPTNNFIKNTYLGTTIGNLIKGDPNIEIAKFLWNNKAFGLLGSSVGVLPLLLGMILLLKLFKNYSKGEIFTRYNSKVYSKLGYLCILSSLIFQPLSQALLSVAVSINYMHGKRFIAISFDNTNLTAIVCGLFLIAIAYVMQIGHEINKEQELTI